MTLASSFAPGVPSVLLVNSTVSGGASLVIPSGTSLQLEGTSVGTALADSGVVVAHGTAKEIRESSAPFVHQFVYGEMDGPVPFRYPADEYSTDLMLGAP